MLEVEQISELNSLVGKPVVIKFHASWCRPCKELAPVIDKLAEENPGIKFVSADTDSAEELVEQYSVTALPTVVTLSDKGELVEKLSPASSASVQRAVRELIGATEL